MSRSEPPAGEPPAGLTDQQIHDLLATPTVHDTGADRITLMGYFTMVEVHRECGVHVPTLRKFLEKQRMWWWTVAEHARRKTCR